MISNLNTKFSQPGIVSDTRELGAITVAETLIALGVGATVLAGVFAGVPALVESRNVSSGLSGLSQITTSVRATFGSRPSFDGLNTELATNLSGFPRNFISGSSVIHPWGGNVEIAGSDRVFSVTFTEMPTDGCASIVTASLDIADSVSVGGTTVDIGATAGDEDEPNPSDIGKLCNVGSPPDVVWQFSG